MPVTHVIHPRTAERLSFEEAPKRLEADGIMPSYAVARVLKEYEDDAPSFNVRPSDVVPDMLCRRQRVWMTSNEYGINPLDVEGLVEGSAFHSQLGAHEIEVPTAYTQRGLGRVTTDEELEAMRSAPDRLDICGVPMRGRIDFLFEDRIEDLKTSTPFWASKFPPKGSADRFPIIYIWTKPERDADDVAKWQIQLSIYRVLLEKSGQSAPAKGRVWKRYGGVKPADGRWHRFDFDLLSEAELEAKVGSWIRSLYKGLQASQANAEAWKDVVPDGQSFIGSRGNLWACDRCPAKDPCFAKDKLEVF